MRSKDTARDMTGDVKTSIHLDAVRNADGQIVIRSRSEAQIHLGQSRLWDTTGFVPWTRGRRVKTAGRFPRWLQTVTRTPGLPAWLYGDGDTFAPRRAKAEPRRSAKP